MFEHILYLYEIIHAVMSTIKGSVSDDNNSVNNSFFIIIRNLVFKVLHRKIIKR